MERDCQEYDWTNRRKSMARHSPIVVVGQSLGLAFERIELGLERGCLEIARKLERVPMLVAAAATDPVVIALVPW